jgi:hypothetical protein
MTTQEMVADDQTHSERHPHWSLAVTDWPADRWDALESAPQRGYPILSVRGRTADGKVIPDMHRAFGGGEEQPPFDGWFAPYPPPTSGFHQVSPVEWQPLHAGQPAAGRPPAPPCKEEK